MSEVNAQLRQDWRFRAMILIILFSAVGYLAFSLWGGWHEVVATFATVGMTGTLIALLLSLINYLVRFVRWQKFLARLGHTVYWKESLRIYISGFGLTILPGKAGEAIRSVFLKHHGINYTQSLAAFFSEQLSNLISMLLLACIGLWSYPRAQPYLLLIGLMIAGILLILQLEKLLKASQHFVRKNLPHKIAGIISSSIEIVLHSRRCFSMGMLIYGISLGLVSWGAEGMAFYYIMHVLGSDLSVQTALFIYAFSMLVGAISFLPGGLGGTEATMVALLLLNNIDQPHAVAATVLIRLATLWFAVALGIIALWMREIRQNASV